MKRGTPVLATHTDGVQYPATYVAARASGQHRVRWDSGSVGEVSAVEEVAAYNSMESYPKKFTKAPAGTTAHSFHMLTNTELDKHNSVHKFMTDNKIHHSVKMGAHTDGHALINTYHATPEQHAAVQKHLGPALAKRVWKGAA